MTNADQPFPISHPVRCRPSATAWIRYPGAALPRRISLPLASMLDLPAIQALEGAFQCQRRWSARFGQGAGPGPVFDADLRRDAGTLRARRSRKKVDLDFRRRRKDARAARRKRSSAAIDPPDEIVNGRIDLGRVTAEFLALGLDPFPRKPDAVSRGGLHRPSRNAHPSRHLPACASRTGRIEAFFAGFIGLPRFRTSRSGWRGAYLWGELKQAESETAARNPGHDGPRTDFAGCTCRPSRQRPPATSHPKRAMARRSLPPQVPLTWRHSRSGGPTNTGKTHLAIERMLAHSSGMIGLPLRLLSARGLSARGRSRGA